RTLGRSARGIIAITAAAAVVALVVVVASAISERPLPGPRIAVVPAVTVLVIGQLWAIIVLRRRHPAPYLLGPREATELFFSPLPRRIALGIFAVAALGLLSAATAIPFLANGTPSATARPACP